jgi:predicted acetyltransferase|tara:strand:+ start:1645 stop:2010 length:366 start_codon:yes stop_codon:yes gene_type:complete
MIKEINLTDFSNHLAEAKKSGLVFCNNTKYYGFFKEDNLFGFCGVLPYKNKWVFKNAFVLEEHRCKGYHKKMMDFRFNLAKQNKIKTIETTCTEMSLNSYIKIGFKITKQYKIYTKLKITL